MLQVLHDLEVQHRNQECFRLDEGAFDRHDGVYKYQDAMKSLRSCQSVLPVYEENFSKTLLLNSLSKFFYSSKSTPFPNTPLQVNI